MKTSQKPHIVHIATNPHGVTRCTVAQCPGPQEALEFYQSGYHFTEAIRAKIEEAVATNGWEHYASGDNTILIDGREIVFFEGEWCEKMIHECGVCEWMESDEGILEAIEEMHSTHNAPDGLFEATFRFEDVEFLAIDTLKFIEGEKQ